MARHTKNEEVRGREHLTPGEVERLATAAAQLGRNGHRDATSIRFAFRHGLRARELLALRRDQLDLESGVFHVRRLKRGVPSTHPLGGREVRDLRRLLKHAAPGPHVFTSERGGHLTKTVFWRIVARAGQAAGFPFPVHPHMLRHACGFKLANEGRDTRAIQHYLGHRNIQHTVRYTALAADRFKDFWDE